MYRYVCHTCDEGRIGETRDALQEFFNEHAERRHEVELYNLRPMERRRDEPSEERETVEE